MATFTLLAGVADDLRSRKIHNALVLGLFAVSLAFSVYTRGFDGTVMGFGALLLALLGGAALFACGVWGGGDAKLFAVFAFASGPTNMFWTLVYSFAWGALYGLTRAALQNQLLTLVRNTYNLAKRKRVEAQQLQKIPYSFALLLGWFTQLTLLRAGGWI